MLHISEIQPWQAQVWESQLLSQRQKKPLGEMSSQGWKISASKSNTDNA